MKLNRPQLDAQVFELIKNTDRQQALEFILKKYRKVAFNKLTLEELTDFVKSFSEPQKRSPDSESHHQM